MMSKYIYYNDNKYWLITVTVLIGMGPSSAMTSSSQTLPPSSLPSPTSPPQPSQVQGVTVTRGVSDGSPSLTVSWTAESGSGITYTVRYSTSSGNTTEPPSGASTMSGITGTSTTLGKLTQGTMYYIWVAADSLGGQGPYSTRVSMTTFEESDASAPTNVLASPLSGKVGIRVSWTAPNLLTGLPITGYSIQYKIRGSGMSYVTVTVGAGTTQGDITGLQSSTEYRIIVATRTGLGTGPYCCQTINTAVFVTTVPPQVQGVTVKRGVSGGSPSLTVSWTAVPGSEINYTVRYSTSSGTETEPPSGASTMSAIAGTSTTLSGLTQGRVYYIWVAAVSSDGQGPYSTRMSQTTFTASDASAPTNVMASSLFGQVGIRVSWTAPTLPTGLPITGYSIQYKIKGSGMTYLTVTVGAGTTQGDITGLQSSTEYRIIVATRTGLGTGPYCCQTTPLFVTTVPGAPTSLMISPPSGSCDQLIVTWTAPSNTGGPGAVSVTYKMYLDGAMQGSSLSTTSKTLSGLMDNKEYTVSVEAVNVAGSGERVTASMFTRPKAPSISSLSASSSTQFIITLTAPDRSSSLTYKCTISTTVSGLYTKTVTGTVLQYTVDGLSPYVTYTVECTSSNEEDSCDSNMDTIRMPSAVPSGPPLNLRAEPSRDSAILTWDPPAEKDQNGVITRYLIKYQLSSDSSSQMTRTVGAVTQLSLDNLMTGATYNFTVAATNSIGTGPDATMVMFTTIPDIENLRISEVTTSTITITWDAPHNGYTVGNRYTEATDSSTEGTQTRKPNGTPQDEHTFGSLNSFREYRMFVRLRNTGGNGSYSSITARTLGKAPTVQPKNFSSIPNITFITVEWSAPDLWERNGIITNYIIEWGETGSLTTLNYPVPNPTFNTTNRLSYNFTGLTPFTTYNFSIAAVNINGTGPFSEILEESTDEEVPGKIKNLTAVSISNKMVTIKWRPPEQEDTFGDITIYTVTFGILGNETTLNVNITPNMNEYHLMDLVPGVPYHFTIRASTNGGYGETEEITFFSQELAPSPNTTLRMVRGEWSGSTLIITWKPLTLHEARGFPFYIIYIDDSEFANTTESNIDVVGLDTSKSYTVQVEVRTIALNESEMGVLSSKITVSARTTISLVALGIGLAFGVIIVLIITVGIVTVVICVCKHGTGVATTVVRKKREKLELNLLNTYNLELDCGSVTPIPANQFAKHVRRMHFHGDMGFEKEYEKVQNDPTGEDNIAREHYSKNRYLNIFTYNHSRVKLLVPDEEGDDYINASYIHGFNRENAYIASQGPTSATIADFLQMVVDHKVPVIVMLTLYEEKAKPKCEKYMGSDDGTVFATQRNLQVVVNSKLEFSDYEKRELVIRNSATPHVKPHRLTHFLYTSWPDHGVPQHPSAMIKFVQQVRKVYNNSSAPMIVHCSAGVGRTGTFITIDTMLQRLNERDDLNIYEFVMQMRTRRTFMVQNQDQYTFIHDAVNDFISCGSTAIASHELRRFIYENDQLESKGKKSKTGFQNEFEKLVDMSKTVSSTDVTNAAKAAIIKRNRYKDRFPYFNNKLCVVGPGKSSANGSDYINASYCNSYSKQKAFIACQAPLETTKEDFWTLSWQLKLETIVVLCNFNNKTQPPCVQFWPTKEEKSTLFGNIKVSYISETGLNDCSVYKMEIENSKMSVMPHFEVTLYHYKEWYLEGTPPLTSLLKLMGDIEGVQKKSSKPIVIMCDDGMGRTGVFITAMSEIERVKIEGEIDIFQTIKSMRTKRPKMVSTVDQYKLCHEILQAYLDSFDTYANFKAV